MRTSANQSIDCNSLPGLKRTALPGGIETSAPVRGLRPIPVLRGRTLNTPKPRSSMRSPLPSAFFMLSKTVSTASSALVLVIPVLLTTSLMISSLITGGSPGGESLQIHQVLDAKGDMGDCQRQLVSRKMAAPAQSTVRLQNLVLGQGKRRPPLDCKSPDLVCQTRFVKGAPC